MRSPKAPGRRAFFRSLAAAGAVLSLTPSKAHAGRLTPAERADLDAGLVVRRSLDVEREEGTYLGGLGYVIIKAPAPFVLGMLRDVTTYKRILSMTIEARSAGHKGADPLIYLKQGTESTNAAYTMRLRHSDEEGIVRFWMDPAFDHDIEDLWGYLRVEALSESSCLATYAVLCDLGLILRVTFGETIRDYALDTPGNLKSAAERDHSAALHTELGPP